MNESKSIQTIRQISYKALQCFLIVNLLFMVGSAGSGADIVVWNFRTGI